LKPASHERPVSPAEAQPSRTGWICVLIFLATLIAYLPALSADFIWDDKPGHVTKPELQSVAGLARIWTDVGATQQYYPLLHTAFWIEHRLWGDWPAGYHLINILLHATAACLVGAVLRRLRIAGAWFAALLFALHPVAVESVAWISEQKNTLSTIFYLCAALTFLRFHDERGRRAYGIATLWFACALLTKTVTATLPAALLVILWWRHAELSWRRDILPLLPWFALSIVAGTLTAWIEHSQIGAQGGDFSLGPIERVLLAGRAVWFYFGKLIWPAELVFIYPRWTIDAGDASQWLFPLAAGLLLAALWWRRRQNRGLLAGALFFGGTLFPALGFVNVFPFLYSYVADHFQYVAMLGILALAAGGATSLAMSLPRWLARAGALTLLLTFGALTWRQAATYRDVLTLYTTTIARNPACWMAHNNLAIALVDAGRAAEAIPHYLRALELRSHYPEAENNLGYALTQLGRPAEALPHLQRAIQQKPTYAEAHNNLGAALMGLGRTGEGMAAFRESARLNPGYAVAHFNLGLALASNGKPADAIPNFQRVLQLNPNYADAELNWAIALTVTQRIPEALPHFERALHLNPTAVHAHVSFGRALAALGRLDEAIARFRTALDLQPTSADTHAQLAIALQQSGRLEEAERHLQTARQFGWR
jgi:tetratricopeptide (TPR) repeat protein